MIPLLRRPALRANTLANTLRKQLSAPPRTEHAHRAWRLSHRRSSSASSPPCSSIHALLKTQYTVHTALSPALLHTRRSQHTALEHCLIPRYAHELECAHSTQCRAASANVSHSEHHHPAITPPSTRLQGRCSLSLYTFYCTNLASGHCCWSCCWRFEPAPASCICRIPRALSLYSEYSSSASLRVVKGLGCEL